MEKYQRILIEVLAPPFLGACILAVRPNAADTLSDRILGFVPFLGAAYAFAILPSLLYMLVMETWFRLGLRARCGLLCTVGLSVLLGCGAGLVIEYVVDFGQISYAWLLWVGGLVGLMIGVYVSRQQTSAA